MRCSLRRFAGFLICGLFLTGALFGQAPATRPKVRTICAFVRIDRANYKAQVADAIKVLVAARDEFVRAGYEVQTVRITTQPFADYTRGLSQTDALKFLREYADYLAGESKRIGTSIAPDIGPAMIADSDSPVATELLTEALSTGSELNASIIVSGDDGIHWNAVRGGGAVDQARCRTQRE